jgi:hypothetical protein
MGTIGAGYDNFGTPWLQVTSGGQISYDTIQQSIGQGYQFGVNGVYMKAQGISQLLQPITLEKNNRRGIFELKNYIPTVDPYQFVSAINSDVVDSKEHESLTFNGLQNFVMPIESTENVYVVFSLEEQSTNNLLQTSPTNFERLEYYDYLADFPDKDGGALDTQRQLYVALRVINNSSSLGIPFLGKVSLLGGAADTYRQSVNSNGLWSWATFNNEPFNVSAINIQYKNAGTPTFQSLTLYGSLTTAQSWANALSFQTGLGLFWVFYNVFNQPVLMTTNDTLDFGTLTYTGTL